MRKLILLLVAITSSIFSFCQSTWPSVAWANTANLSGILSSSIVELSGLYWNNDTKRLLAVGDAGYFAALQYNGDTGQFTLIGSVKNSDGPEGITQVNTKANEFYSIDENSYEIRKYSYNTSFTTVTKLNSWNLLVSPSPMTDTGNTGPEGICFVPDSYLQKIGFVSSATGAVYTSKKGMGGLLFLAHQNGGYVWVFDINPDVNNDFFYVGKYKTNRSESCDLAFDNSTGLMYILHNLDDNYLEITDLKTSVSGNVYTLTKQKEYFIPNPTSGSTNIEGFAISPKYPENESQGVWLCRDVTKTSEIADALRWFKPYTADGSNIKTGFYNQNNDINNRVSIKVSNELISFSETPICTVSIFSFDGRCIQKFAPKKEIKHNLKKGLYYLITNNLNTKFYIN
jgi:hypothetical protein